MKEKTKIVFRGQASSPSPRPTKPTEIAGRRRRQKRTTAAVGGSSIITIRDDSPVKDDAKNKLRLVYPFDDDAELLSDAAFGLKELSGDMLGLGRADIGVQGQLGKRNVADGTKKPTRTNYLAIEIRDADLKTLCSETYVNDGPEGRSLYCLNLNCRAPPGRLFRSDLSKR